MFYIGLILSFFLLFFFRRTLLPRLLIFVYVFWRELSIFFFVFQCWLIRIYPKASVCCLPLLVSSSGGLCPKEVLSRFKVSASFLVAKASHSWLPEGDLASIPFK